MAVLSIDVQSELENLCEAQLRGTWQVPAEIVRLALRIGARDVSVNRRRRGLAVTWNGPALDRRVLDDLQNALDQRRPPDDRQRAIAALERSGAEGLLWAAGLRGSRLLVERVEGSRRWRFEHRRRGRPRLSWATGRDEAETSKIWWSCSGLDRGRALRWLSVATRFSPVPVVIDGRMGPRGFAGGLYHLRLDEPLPCRIGLTRWGDHPALWLLQDGIVSSRAGVPGYPPFEAAVELGGEVSPGASGADLRRAVTPFLGQIVDRAVWMMVEVADRMPEMAAEDRRRIALVLLRAARRRLRDEEIRRLPLVPTMAEEDHRLSVYRIGELAKRRGGVVPAIDPDNPPAEGVVDPHATLVASSEIRGLLSELIAVRFQAPPRRIRSLFARLKNRLRDAVAELARRFRGRYRYRPLPASDLSAGETALLGTLRSVLAPTGVELCEGQGPVGRTQRGLVVPRANEMLKVGLENSSESASWLYPLLLALDTGRTPPAGLRDAWLRDAGVETTGE